ncbi:hypothetical protein [Ferrovum myxofaciens]|uniref:hypothetical protein n=1 Tax=Ferrovum myxofaciens TaxID=416213 RepID=UPI003EB70446
MKVKTAKKVVEVFGIQDLGEEAMQKAVSFARTNIEYDLSPAEKSFSFFAKGFSTKVVDILIDPRKELKSIEIDMKKRTLRFSYLKASYFNLNRCPTGHWLDQLLVRAFVANFKETGRGKKAFLAAIEMFTNTVYENMQQFYTDESLKKMVSEKGWLFTENGGFAGEDCLIATKFQKAA